MQMIKTIPVKRILTEASQADMYESLQQQLLQLEKECEQLRFEWRRHERMKSYDKEQVRQKYESEINRRLDKKTRVAYQMEQLQQLPLGSEIDDGHVQSVVDVNVGDHWDEQEAVSALIIKDGVVYDIR